MGKGWALVAFATLALVVLGGEARSQSSSPINPSTRPLGSDDYSRIPIYRTPEYRPVYDGKGRRIGTIEESYGPLGTDYTYRDRRWTPRASIRNRASR